MRGDEDRVVDAFCAYLRSDGWTVAREVDHVDVQASKGGVTLFAEAKGRTQAMGLDVDTLYGQLLRRVPSEAHGARLGVVVPDVAVSAALRVPDWIRERLRVSVWSVDSDPHVRLVYSPPNLS